ncbi:type II secretion system F family protein [Paenibacillus mesophilus]|nr:type II secretion system F family protein [Paenibacillus mesophilus]TMV52640.1 type II secretion system F family protein [Paenibacillus mesophilus]
MPKFMYKAVDDYGKYSKGALEAQSFQQAVEELKSRGLWVLHLFDPSKSILHKEIAFGGPKVKNEHFTVFCRQLATMYKAGISMVEAVRVLGEQSSSKEFKKILARISEDMQRGTQFSAAAAQYPTVFSVVFVSMIRAGEASGNLDDMLTRLASFYEKEHNTKEKVKSAMIYPIVMGFVTILVVSLMMTFVIPRYIANFQAMGLELPLPTRIIIAISDWMLAYWYLIPLFAAAPGLLIGSMKKSKLGTYYWDLLRLRIPVFGKLAHKQSIARFCRTFSSLHSAAIPMLQTMTIVSSVVGNEVIGKLILQSREGLRNGSSIAEPFRGSWLFPPMVVQMLAIGERAGALDSMLEKVADFYEADVDAMADRLKSLLEPFMILFISGIVGGIVTALMLPTFKLMQNLH